MNNLKNIFDAAAIAERQALTLKLVKHDTNLNNHTAALMWVTKFVKNTTTDGERFMKADRLASELEDIDRCHRSAGFMWEGLGHRRQHATNNLKALVIEEGGVELWETFNREL